jgi:hypothetical protein
VVIRAFGSTATYVAQIKPSQEAPVGDMPCHREQRDPDLWALVDDGTGEASVLVARVVPDQGEALPRFRVSRPFGRDTMDFETLGLAKRVAEVLIEQGN